MGYMWSRNIQIFSNKFLQKQFISYNRIRNKRVRKKIIKKNFLIYYSENSFNSVDLWLKDLKANSSPDIKIFLIGNKSDLEDQRKIKSEQGESFAEQYDIDLFMESSAKTGMNVNDIFIKAAKILYKDYLEYSIEKKNKKEIDINTKILNNNKPDKKKKGCC